MTVSNVTLSGSAASWTNLSNATTSNNAYASCTLSSNGDISDYLQLSNFGFNIPTSSIILGIVVEVERFGDKVKDHQVRIVKGGVIGATDRSLTSNWPNTDPNSYVSYGSSIDNWGETWTATDINSTNFGFALSTVRVGGGQVVATPNVDHIQITVYYDVPLPVRVLSFSSDIQQGSITLKWSTAWEKDNSHFEIERASEALNFSTIGFVNGNNISNNKIDYTFVDENPGSKSNFYRLKQHDFNGNYAYSEVIRSEPMINVLPKLAPTFVTTHTTLNLRNQNIHNYQLTIYSAQGLPVLQLQPKTQETIIPSSQLPTSGVYFYNVTYRGAKVEEGRLWVNK